MILNIVLAAVVIILGVKLAMTASNKSEEAASSEDAVLQNIAARTSIRAYENKPVEKHKVEKLLRAGMAAPSALNKQPWHFVVIDERELLDEIGSQFPNAKAIKTAPLAIVVCGNMDKAIEGTGKDFWIQDASAATQNILLAATSMGLGSLWTGFYPDPDRVSRLSKLLALPENLVPLNVILVGYAAEQPTPKDKYKEENISYNGYDAE